jgi:hypothetical protein
MRSFVLDLLDTIEEQIQHALLDPNDQYAAVTVAAGVIPLIRERLREDEHLQAKVMLVFDNQCYDRWREWWQTLAKRPTAEFPAEANKLLDTVKLLKQLVEEH